MQVDVPTKTTAMKYKVIRNNDALIQPLKQANPRLYEALKRELWIDVPNSGFTDRGDVGVVDQTLATLIADSAWHRWDLSAIVPSGAKSILFHVWFLGNVVDLVFAVRRGGTLPVGGYVWNQSVIRCQVANQMNNADLVVACDVNRVIEYLFSGGTSIGVVVRGWW